MTVLRPTFGSWQAALEARIVAQELGQPGTPERACPVGKAAITRPHSGFSQRHRRPRHVAPRPVSPSCSSGPERNARASSAAIRRILREPG